ncbi:ferredoxin-dependent glutamate synthase [Ignisphaera aggregans DSM 17230]|uniref:Ferredoxin-dependent glutamate synthase n=1 Tax=Ignisphaera aggregans (strain DSM 17230 / JCM 13409 / AQ1.S1) TaxID=583356 RepID=E0STY8_IGNAA|nr:ferredoxin-dependent glutamate synthase [Ignisphaera aggregans DSM 17230]
MPEKKLPTENSSILTGTRTRTTDITPISGLCALCIGNCPVLCEVGKAAIRGRETLYPEPEEFGNSTAAANKDYGLDWSDLQLVPRLTEVFGVEPIPENMIFSKVDVSSYFGGINLKLPVTIAALGSTDVAKRNWDGIAIGAAVSGTLLVIGENVCGMDREAVIVNGQVQSSKDMEYRVRVYREYWNGRYGDIGVQTNIEDEMLGVDIYAVSKLEVNTIEKKFGQGAKSIGGEVRVYDINRAIELKRRGYIVIPDPEDKNVQEAYRLGIIRSFERHSRVGKPDVERFMERIDKLRSMGTKRILIKTGCYRPADVAFVLKLASEVKADGVTFDGAGGGTGMSPVVMMNESGVPTIYLEAWVLKGILKLREKGRHIPDIAMAGGFSNEHQIVKAIAMSNFGDGPYVKAVAMARAPLLAVMKAKYFVELSKKNALPPDFAKRYGSDPESFFIATYELFDRYGKEKLDQIINSGAVGLYTYFTKIAEGMRILMAGQRKYAIKYLDRSDLAALTERAARVTGLPLMDEVDKNVFDVILG